LKPTQRFVVLSVGGATRSQICGEIFPKRKQSATDFVPTNTSYLKINPTHSAQHFALHPAGIALPQWPKDDFVSI